MAKDEFSKEYGLDWIEYRFRFYNKDERKIHVMIIQYLAKSLAKLKLVKDKAKEKQ